MSPVCVAGLATTNDFLPIKQIVNSSYVLTINRLTVNRSLRTDDNDSLLTTASILALPVMAVAAADSANNAQDAL